MRCSLHQRNNTFPSDLYRITCPKVGVTLRSTDSSVASVWPSCKCGYSAFVALRCMGRERGMGEGSMRIFPDALDSCRQCPDVHPLCLSIPSSSVRPPQPSDLCVEPTGLRPQIQCRDKRRPSHRRVLATPIRLASVGMIDYYLIPY